MNFAILTRLLWKEYRTYRAYGLLLAAMTPLVILLMRWYSTTPMNDYLGLVVSLTSLVALCFALGASGSCFAYEKDDRTREFLEALPLKSSWTGLAKIVVVVLGTLLVAAVSMICGLAALGSNPFATVVPEAWQGIAVVIGVLVIGQVILWGIFSSLYCSQAYVAILVAALGWIGTYVLYGIIDDVGYTPQDRWYSRIYAYGVVVFIDAVLLGLIILRLPRWHSPAGSRRRKNVWHSSTGRPDGSFVTECRRMLWQQWRAGWLSYVCVVVISLISLAVAPFELGVLCFIGALVGVTAFHEDQLRGNFRIFAEQGIDARRVWWARQLRGLFTTFALTLAFIALTLVRESHQQKGTEEIVAFIELMPPSFFVKVATFLAPGFLGYAFGQVFSFYTRSVVISLGIGLIASFGGSFFLMAMQQVCPKLIFMVVLLLTPLWLGLTWYHARSWCTELKWTKARILAAAAVPLALALAIGAIALARIYEIPAVEINPQDFPESNLLTPEAERTANFYEEMAKEFITAPSQQLTAALSLLSAGPVLVEDGDFTACKKWLAEHQDDLDRCQRWEDYSTCYLNTDERRSDAILVFHWVIFRAHTQLMEGRIDDAIATAEVALRMSAGMVGVSSQQAASAFENVNCLLLSVLQYVQPFSYRPEFNLVFRDGGLPRRSLTPKQRQRISAAFNNWKVDDRVIREVLRQQSVRFWKASNSTDVFSFSDLRDSKWNGNWGPRGWYELMPGERERMRRLLRTNADRLHRFGPAPVYSKDWPIYLYYFPEENIAFTTARSTHYEKESVAFRVHRLLGDGPAGIALVPGTIPPQDEKQETQNEPNRDPE